MFYFIVVMSSVLAVWILWCIYWYPAGLFLCPSAIEVILIDMGKINYCQTTIKHNKVETMCIILGMYYIFA